MGFYVNPKGGTKEAFLKEKGVEVPIAELSFEERPKGTLPVIWINNNDVFSAAGVAFSNEELAAFTDFRDRRPKRCYYVEIDDLIEASDLTKTTVDDYDLREGGV